MIIYPAIDLFDQQSVRLIQGDYDRQSSYGDPVKMAQKWVDKGATYLHLVDLNAAKGDTNNNMAVIADIIEAVDVPVQVGGGVRSIQRIEALLSLGVTRVILGTAAIKDPEFLKVAVERYAEQVVISVDARDGYVATDGWKETSSKQASTFVKELEAIGVQTIVYTDISKDGMLAGPNLTELQDINTLSEIDVIASGGVTTLEDLRTLQANHLSGAIIGKALYEGKIDFESIVKEL
ncbi:1-(5-phosphoribosyl)-5-[(5-phosphoribosylamino)methylideneamino]imidazole-4-carboxamide isomerase [Halalkalibacillus halophilus]|uniref:1-(5-phosphoribosyl)-5-[(5- phosphoribosylamino)methylideneamino]imidazole-4- carboxamide isomerase n=1 Tax=Halalkalibacillus halophilus TaxID=392827 RepID=UPI00041236E3|nr:1-(5-phosphoribosyl)-5-[(5-phosphoribosylamino)methylideneamino]imidazole-4-carboxamide isomerase [Halalkalibacillus halophilus]